MSEFDVVVSGGGLIGLSAAHAFAQRGFQTLLLDSAETPDTQGRLGTDIRTVALSPVAHRQLSQLCLHDDWANGEIERMFVWEGDGTAHMEMCASDVGEKNLAVVLEVSTLVRALQENAPTNLIMRLGSAITDIAKSERTLLLDERDSVRTQLLVIAEGTQSHTVGLLKTQYDEDTNLAQRTLATVVEFEQPHNNCAWQKFAPTPVALLPLANNNHMAVLWSLPNKEAQLMLRQDDQTFCTQLASAVEFVCGNALQVDRRFTFPLTHRLLSDFNPYSWILVFGDAAHTLHPLAGQGVNLGLEDVRVLANVLDRNQERLDTPGLWREYATKRKLRALSAIKLMTFFSKIYSASNPFARLVRNAGVRIVNSNTPIKRQLIREAMGIAPVANVR